MSKHLRNDTTCQNCGEYVGQRFCGVCGQENTETRQSFGHLTRHFIEDLTHYDGAFWRTMKYLLFRPAHLTKEYLAGKRMSFVPPVRLYIFISFVTFLLPYILPEVPDSADYTFKRQVKSDSIAKIKTTLDEARIHINYELVILPNTYTSIEQMDSVQQTLKPSEQMGSIKHWLQKKYFAVNKYSSLELGDKFFGSVFHNFPKALFLFMPLFALVLWLFHGKKRWLYFDHSIFTLHYFSFILLVFNLLSVSEQFFFLGDRIGSTISQSVFIIVCLALFVYFFIAHKKMYGETKLVSFTKSLVIFGINIFFLYFIMIFLAIVTLLNIH